VHVGIIIVAVRAPTASQTITIAVAIGALLVSRSNNAIRVRIGGVSTTLNRNSSADGASHGEACQDQKG
jgi:hypothetical protein